MIAETLPGMSMGQSDAKLVSERKKTVFIRAESIKKYVGEEVFIIHGQQVYAKITFTKPEKINLQKFKEMRMRHRITDEVRKQIWGKKRTFYAYKIRIIEIYAPPISTFYNVGDAVEKPFIDEIKITKEDPKPEKESTKTQNTGGRESTDSRLRDFEESIVERRLNAIDSESQEPLEGRRLGDYIPSLDREQVQKVILQSKDGVLNEEPPREREPRERTRGRKKGKNPLANRVERLRKVAGQGNRETIRESDSVKQIKKENKPVDLKARFAEKLKGN
jgi:hypothetical protein